MQSDKERWLERFWPHLLGNGITILVFLIAFAVGYGKLTQKADEATGVAHRVEEKVDVHITSPSLHNNLELEKESRADMKARLDRIQAEQVRLSEKVDDLTFALAAHDRRMKREVGK